MTAQKGDATQIKHGPFPVRALFQSEQSRVKRIRRLRLRKERVETGLFSLKG